MILYVYAFMAKNNVDFQVLLTVLFLLVSIAAGLFLVHYVLRARGHERFAYVAQVLSLAASWWAISVSLVMTDRFFLGLSGGAFSYPVTLTEMHTFIKGLIACTILMIQTKPGYSSRQPLPDTCDTNDVTPPATPPRALCRPHLKSRFMEIIRLQRINRQSVCLFLLPMGLFTGIDVWSSKFALQYLDVSVYTVVKSSALIFTFIFSLLLKLHRFSWMGFLSTVGVMIGVMLSTVKEAPVDTVGVIVTVFGSATSAARWVLTQRYFGRRAIKPSAVAILALQAPFTLMTLLPMWVAEMPSLHHLSAVPNGYAVFAGLALGGGMLAFGLLWVEVQLVNISSALSMNIIGQMKDVAAVALAITIFHESFTPYNAAGTALALICAMLYSYVKARQPPEAGMLRLPNADIELRPAAVQPPPRVEVAIDLDGSSSESETDEAATLVNNADKGPSQHPIATSNGFEGPRTPIARIRMGSSQE